jgi:choline dehydrogenase-like flavoprotein
MAAGSYDYVIVGAGSAGCVLAGRLSADPACRVLLLEAGGSDRKREIRIPAAFTKLLRTGYDWDYRTSKQPQLSDRQVYWPRGKTLGGSSAINGQIWTRGHRVDYDGWAQSCPGWSYDEVLPYFQRAEHRVGSNAGGYMAPRARNSSPSCGHSFSSIAVDQCGYRLGTTGASLARFQAEVLPDTEGVSCVQIQYRPPPLPLITGLLRPVSRLLHVGCLTRRVSSSG